MSVWSLVHDADNDNEEEPLALVAQVQAYERAACNRVCFVRTESDDAADHLEFVTCANGLPTKVWLLERDATAGSGHIKSVQSIVSINVTVHSLFVGSFEPAKFVVIAEDPLPHLQLQFFHKNNKSNNKFACVRNVRITDGVTSDKCLMAGISAIKMSAEGMILMTMYSSELITLDLKKLQERTKVNLINLNELSSHVDLCTRLKASASSSSSSSDDSAGRETEQRWLSTSDVTGDRVVVAGDNKGGYYYYSSIGAGTATTNRVLQSGVKPLHTHRIGEVISFELVRNATTKRNCCRVLTMSHDGTVKIWSDMFEYQLGQYTSSTKITSVVKVPPTSSERQHRQQLFVFGDQMGNIELIKWHDE